MQIAKWIDWKLCNSIVTLCVVLTGCASHYQRISNSREEFYLGNLDAAAEQIQKQIKRYRRDGDALLLDLAMIQLVNGHAESAEQSLREIRDRFDYLEQSDLREKTASLLTDDRSLAYSGDDYERVLLRVFLTLSNLMHDGGDAESYSLQVNAKQQQLWQLAQRNGDPIDQHAYPPLAVGPYLHGVLREATHRHYDDAQRAFAQVVSWQPNYLPGREDLERATSGQHSQPGNGVLYVFNLSGRGPIKVETTAPATSQALLIADRILSAVGKYDLPPTIAPVKIPAIHVPPQKFDYLEVSIGDHPLGHTRTICDIADLACRQYDASFNSIVARAVARRAVKKASVYIAKDQLAVSSPWTDLAMSAAGVAWEATEAADTRCWGLLPREIQVLRVELKAGDYPLRLLPVSAKRPGAPVSAEVEIVDGANTYVMAYCVDGRVIGEVLTKSRP